MSTEKHYEMLWDCQYCGTTKLLGKTHRFCPICGAAQNPESRYFPPDDEKVAVEDHKLVGADVICPACSVPNAGDAVHCGNCGAALEGAAKAGSITGDSWMGKDNIPEKFRQSRNLAAEKFDRDMETAGVKPKEQPDKKQRRIPWVAIAIGLVVACGALIFVLTRTEPQNVVVTGHSWERTIRLEEYTTVRDGAWQNSVPINARNESCYQKQSGTNRIPDGEDCRMVRRDNGDGTFSESRECTTRYREEPVYDTWCDYDIDRWTTGRRVSTDGNGLNPAPYWGEVNLRCTGERIGCERESGRDELYKVTLAGEKDTYTCDYPQERWQSLAIESVWSLEVNSFGLGASCDTLAPAQ